MADWDTALPQEAADEPWWTNYGYDAEKPPEWIEEYGIDLDTTEEY